MFEGNVILLECTFYIYLEHMTSRKKFYNTFEKEQFLYFTFSEMLRLQWNKISQNCLKQWCTYIPYSLQKLGRVANFSLDTVGLDV
jgi:hypothetical protein